MSKIGTNLKILMAKYDIKQGDFAKSVGVTPVSMSRYVNGTRVPTANLIIKICKKYEVSADWLLGLKEDKKMIEVKEVDCCFNCKNFKGGICDFLKGLVGAMDHCDCYIRRKE